MCRPEVSVVLPVRDGGRYLSEAVHSIQSQTVANLEILCVDDGSTDDTPVILQRLARDPRISCFQQKRAGPFAALNRGIRAARSDIVAVMHADDVALPDRLERQIEYLDAHPNVGVVGSSAMLIDASGMPRGELKVPTDHRDIRRRLISRNLVIHPTVTCRREALVECGLYRASAGLTEDYDLWLRMVSRWDVANIAQPLLQYRLHGDSLSARAHRGAVRDALRARWRAIAVGSFSWWDVRHLVLPALSLGLPTEWSRRLRAFARQQRGHFV